MGKEEFIFSYLFDDFSLFLEEGKNLLIEEFGKEYTTYFSILSLIASSKTARIEIESVNDYTLIRKVKPIFAKDGSRTVKYEIIDNYFNFWFRFIYKYKSAIEIENYEFVKDIVKRDFSVYSGRFLEKYFSDKIKLDKQYSKIGTYWEKDNLNEIDIIAINELDKKALICEVKINPKKINMDILRNKAIKLEKVLKSYTIQFKGLSLIDM